MMRTRILAFLAAALISGAASAQVKQSGVVTNGHAASWATTGVIQDAGTASSGVLTTLGITNTGVPLCINDAAITGGYHQLCFGANSLGGGLLSYNAYGGASTLPFQVNINGVTASLGTGTVNAGTANHVTYYATSTDAVSSAAYLTINNGDLNVGLGGSVLGTLGLGGSSSGAVTIKPQAAAGVYNFNLPITAGTSGQVLTSSGGGSAPMTWTSIGGTVNTGTTGQAAYYAADGTAVSGTSALVLTSTAVTMSPSGAVTINPASASTMNNVVIGGATPAAATFTTASATGQISSGVSGVSLGSLALSGNSSGTVVIKPQAAAGSFNFNIPITAGTSGQPLLSGGGGASAMTWGLLSGNTSTFATTSGSLTNGHAATFDGSGNIVDGGALPTGTINSGTAGQLTYYAGSGTTVSGNANATVSSGALTMGVIGATAGSVILSGSSTGAITVKGSGTTIGTYNLNLPITVGTSGGPLLSGGGGAAAMTWGTVSGNTSKFTTLTGSTTNGNCAAFDASGNLIDNGSPCGTGGSGTVTSSTAGQIAYYASSTNAVAGNSSLTISGSTVTVGVSTTSTGKLTLAGGTSGAVTIQPQAAAGTFNFNLPITAGTAGQFLTSQGGGSTAMTWNSAGLAAITSQTTSFSASANSQYCTDTTGGAVTATLPASPANNDTILFVACSAFSTNNLIIGRNGNNIQGLTEDMTVNNDNAAFHLVFVTSYGWRMY